MWWRGGGHLVFPAGQHNICSYGLAFDELVIPKIFGIKTLDRLKSGPKARFR